MFMLGICGLPNSGQHLLIKEMSRVLNFHFETRMSKEILNKCIANKKSFIIMDDSFIFKSSRKEVEEKVLEAGFLFEWLFFENNKEQCIINSLGDPDEIKFIEEHAVEYIIPNSVDEKDIVKVAKLRNDNDYS